VARPGTASRTGRDASSPASADTRAALVEAAVDALREDGFGGASARGIAKRASVNQGLVFYHFGSVANLLLAALDEVSARRLARYQEAVDGVSTLPELVEVASDIFREDLDNGYVTVLVEMIAGSSSTPGLGAAVAERIAPWRSFAGDAMAGALDGTAVGQLVPSEAVAHAVVALYLGLELLAHLDDDRRPALALFEQAGRLAGLLGMFGTPQEKKR
jgi:AcrR family transcriptional regulator